MAKACHSGRKSGVGHQHLRLHREVAPDEGHQGGAGSFSRSGDQGIRQAGAVAGAFLRQVLNIAASITKLEQRLTAWEGPRLDAPDRSLPCPY
ncbi:MAG: hypothetical protein NTW51_14955 [Cyanobacteria bacterium]|nr:hypothetical protein [Cyanobacteriota bacterium]